MNLSLTRKLSLPKEAFAKGICLKKTKERPENVKSACMNCIIPQSPPSLLCPPCVSLSLNTIRTPEQKFHATSPKNCGQIQHSTHKLQAVLLSQTVPPTLLCPAGHFVHAVVSKKDTALILELSFSKHVSKELSPTGSCG